MVKITNGVDVIEVTRGAFENIYKSQGFVEADAPKEKRHKVEENPEDKQKHRDEEEEEGSKEPDELEEEEEFEEQRFVKELEEKPLTSWNKKEIKKYCSIEGIDISGTKSADEAKEIIKNFLTEA